MSRWILVPVFALASGPALAAPCTYSGSVPEYVECIADQAWNALVGVDELDAAVSLIEERQNKACDAIIAMAGACMASVPNGAGVLVRAEMGESGDDACLRAEDRILDDTNRSVTSWGFECVRGWTDGGYSYDECASYPVQQNQGLQERHVFICCSEPSNSAPDALGFLRLVGERTCPRFPLDNTAANIWRASAFDGLP